MIEDKYFTPKNMLLGIQHLFAMFGATVLVPTLTGLNPAVGLMTAGIGTLIFHLCTKRKVPVFVGSSFAYIVALQQILEVKEINGVLVANPDKIPYAQGGIMAAGLVYVMLSLIVYKFGVDKIKSFFPAVVVGPIIVVIGLNLAPTALSMAKDNWVISILTLLVVIGISVFAKGFFKLVPILIGIFTGYFASILFDIFSSGADKMIDFSIIKSAPFISPVWDFSGVFFTFPKFDLHAILLIAPIALVTFMEHIGDITTNGSVVGKDFLKDPGLHRTLLGDGMATIFAGMLGGPANTTYGENTGVLAVTKVYSTKVIRLAACFAIILGLLGKFAAILRTIPSPVMGGVSILLFGMIASVGMRTISEANLDFSHSRNLIIVALILVLGIGLSGGVVIGGISFSGLFVAVLVGAFANKVLPKEI